nr:putative F-box protein At1g50870 [Quercus suber]
MFTTNEVLPEDLVIQILLWLPVVSLLRFKCICKSWCALINGQNFINKHLLHNQTTSNKNRNAGFLLIQRQKSSNDHVFSKLQYESLEILSTQAVKFCYGCRWCLYCDSSVSVNHGVLSLMAKTSSISTFSTIRPPLTRTGTQYFGIPNHAAINIVSSINGLVCLDLNVCGLDIVLWNPATNETKVVPKSAEVYCLSTGSWRTVSTSAPGYFIDCGYYRTYTKGMFSWSASIGDYPDFFPGILSFDMSNEVFLTTTLPDGDLEDPNDRERLENCFYIWSLLEFGVKESWTKLFTIGPLMGIEKPL